MRVTRIGFLRLRLVHPDFHLGSWFGLYQLSSRALPSAGDGDVKPIQLRDKDRRLGAITCSHFRDAHIMVGVLLFDDAGAAVTCYVNAFTNRVKAHVVAVLRAGQAGNDFAGVNIEYKKLGWRLRGG